VDCIFIDPPYNTGNESWCYNDNVNSPMMKEWLSTNPVNKEDMLRHDKWLAMMWPRLKLLHELLAETGSFWMTLDDNEIHRARMMLDEIFGEENFVATCIWHKNYAPKPSAQFFSEDHDYLLIYAKNKEIWRPQLLERTDDMDSRYSNPDNDLRGPWKPGDLSARNYYSEGIYPITCRSGRIIDGPPGGNYWRVKESKFKEMDKDGRIWWGEDGNNVPAIKRFLSEVRQGRVPQTLWEHSEAGHTQDAKKELLEVLNFERSEDVFITPKPVALVDRILQLATDDDSLILDSFAGSATTAHAVLEANKKDGGNRKFILVECEDYADRLTAERVRRVMQGYEFTGTQREELLRENLTFTSLKKADELLAKVDEIERRHARPETGKTRVLAQKGSESGQTGLFGEDAETPAAKPADTARRFDKITKTVKDGVLLVQGETQVRQRTEGLGGAFTFCTLGEALDIDGILTGANLPDFAALGAWLFHTATGEALTPATASAGSGVLEEWYLGESSAYYVWLIYRPELDFLKSRDGALTLSLAESISQAKTGKRHLVFAPAKYVPNKTLLPLGVEYSPLPFALYRVEKT